MKSRPPLPVRVITHNIRYAPIVPSPGEARWPYRRPLLASHFHYHASSVPNTIICMQEVLEHQLHDLLSELNAYPAYASTYEQDQKTSTLNESNRSEWAYVGVGRDDGGEAGEFNPIFYRPSVWELREHTVEWLSPIPKEKGWDAGSIRIVTIVILAHRTTKQELLVMNTHLDNKGVIARREGARIIDRLARQWSKRESSDERKSEDCPLVLTGDLNSNEEGEAYKYLAAHVGYDARNECPERARYGEEKTFTGFRGRKDDEERIDYIFAGPCESSQQTTPHRDYEGKVRSAWNVRGYAVLPNRFEQNGIYHSDHRAVVADLELN
ncbi:MAG: hypothetical protein M1828_006851 [Chrysothrix sp. TS-e1954]|nr:MAG: hypothetical protein M1828_006851 [Chrysothrix sp. TS-e1954]